MKKENIIQTVLNVLLGIGVLVGDVFYILADQLLVKTLASAAFFLMGLLNIFYSFKQNRQNINFAMIMTLGLFFAMLGDILLELFFILGAGFFAIGHVFYFFAYCKLVKFSWKDLIAGGVLALIAVLFILIAPIFNLDVVMKIVIVFYAVVISFMLGKSITNVIRERNLLNVLILVGSFLFFFSDLMLLLRIFTDFPDATKAILGALCLGTYYPAEIILAISILFLPKSKEKTEE